MRLPVKGSAISGWLCKQFISYKKLRSNGFRLRSRSLHLFISGSVDESPFDCIDAKCFNRISVTSAFMRESALVRHWLWTLPFPSRLFPPIPGVHFITIYLYSLGFQSLFSHIICIQFVLIYDNTLKADKSLKTFRQNYYRFT